MPFTDKTKISNSFRLNFNCNFIYIYMNNYETVIFIRKETENGDILKYM